MTGTKIGASGGLPLALTVRQPWASAIVLGFKPVENRSWTTAHRGQLLIHAAARSDPHWRASAQAPLVEQIRPPSLWKCVHGLIIGMVTLADIVTDSPSPWANGGSYHWVLTDPAVLDDPVPARGRLHLWVPEGEW